MNGSRVAEFLLGLLAGSALMCLIWIGVTLERILSYLKSKP